MSEIQGGGGSTPITPREKRMYEQEYKHGAQLFEKALDQYAKSTSPFQQHEFSEVMDKAMDVLNKTAAELHQKSLLEQNAKIAKDYQTFLDDPKAGVKDLRKDLDQAQKFIG